MSSGVKTIEFRYSKSALAWLVLGSAAFAGLSAAASLHLFGNVAGVQQFLMYCGVLFFGAATVVWATRLFQSDPIVEVSAQGIRDRRISTDLLAWTTIEQVSVAQVRRQRFLQLRLRLGTPLNRSALGSILTSVNKMAG